jgi:adenosine deaminase
MPKAELHLHLDGSLRLATALELADELGLVPAGSNAERAGWIRDRLVGPRQVRDQLTLLRAFDLPVALMQTESALQRITVELIEDVANDGTRYAEIKWAPTLHLERLDLRDGIAAVVRGAEEGMRRSPDVVVRLVAVVLRSHSPELGVAMAEAAAGFVERGLTGLDLAGQEAVYPDPGIHGRAFQLAREAGLGITIHAGEWGGAAQVRRALQVGPTRIAHGTPAWDDPQLQRELIDRGVSLDLCPTSNIQAAIVARYEDHPLPRLLRAGVPVTLGTDDRTVSDLSLVREYARAHASLGITLPELWSMDRHALEVAFLQHDEALRTRLRQGFEAFGRAEPRLRC